MREMTPEQRDLAVAKSRVETALHLSDLLTMTTYGGSKDYLAMRLQEVARAEKEGDDIVLRASLMELSLAAASWAASLDLSLPYESRARRRRNGG